MTSEKIWFEDPKVLVEPRNWGKYLPKKGQSKNEKLNSLVRLSLYISVIFVIISLNMNYIFVLLITAFLTYLVHISQEKQNDATLKKEIENYEDLEKDTDYQKRNLKIKDYVGKCSIPTNNNPFMNFLVTDKRDKKRACASYKDPKIKELVEDKFNKKLYRDINSVYGNENSQREFYTMPNTEVMNRQKELGEWLYLTPKTCKEGNGNQCVANNPERLIGPIPGFSYMAHPN
jgi:hypothetical protein